MNKNSYADDINNAKQKNIRGEKDRKDRNGKDKMERVWNR